jgi:carboxyl-terminal processing protease
MQERTSENTSENASTSSPAVVASRLTKREIWLPTFIALAMAAGIAMGLKLQNESLLLRKQERKVADNATTEISGQGRMEEILRYVDAKYVDEVNNQAMIDRAINNLLEELDPHSIYIPSEQADEVNSELDGEQEGVGIETLWLDDTLTIVAPLSDSPAEKAGLLSGDKIININDSSAIDKNDRWIRSHLTSKRGQPIRLSILRGGNSRPITVNLERDRVQIHSIDGAVQLDATTGYIKVSRFSANTSREFNNSLNDLFEKKGIKNLIVDLRGNSGGYLDKAVDMLSQFFPEKDKLLVYTKGRTVHRNEYKSTGRQRFKVGKLAVLMDEGSASASEIVAGAVQDCDRGIIIGRRSFGKGLVQEPYLLSDGSELRLTVARYFTPSGRSIQKEYKGKSIKEYDEEEHNRSLTNTDSSFSDEKARYYTAKGRIVYGGGGIAPDVYVAPEPWLKNESYVELKKWALEYAFRYYSKEKKSLKFRDWQEFQRNFRVTDYSFGEFVRYAERQGANHPPSVSEIKEPLKLLIKARIARQLYGDEGYYGIMNDNDACVKQALYALQKEDPLGLRQVAQKK